MQSYEIFSINGKKTCFFRLFYKKYPIFFVGSRKSCTFATAKAKYFAQARWTLGYGVMVTLQILVLPFLVRVRVPQQKNPLSLRAWRILFFVSPFHGAGKKPVPRCGSLSTTAW